MAKQKIDLPSADAPTGDWSQPVDVKECLQKAQDMVMSNIGYSSSQPDEQLGYVSTNMVHMHAPNRADTKITRSQALCLMEKLRKLQDEGAQLKDGSPIRNKSDVVRWMIEQPLAPIR
jgi:hypothetical protein